MYYLEALRLQFDLKELLYSRAMEALAEGCGPNGEQQVGITKIYMLSGAEIRASDGAPAGCACLASFEIPRTAAANAA